MGLDVTFTVEIEADDDFGPYRSDVCEVWGGRFYHWQDALALAGCGVVTFTALKRRKDREIFDRTVADTSLYIIMRALAKRYGKRHVWARWEAR